MQRTSDLATINQRKINFADNQKENISQNPFNRPQRISPVPLEAINRAPAINNIIESAIKNNSTTQTPRTMTAKREIGIMTCNSLSRNIAVSTNQKKVRSCGTECDFKMYTKEELQSSIDMTIEKYMHEKATAKRKNQITIGTQCISPNVVPERKHESIQTELSTRLQQSSVGCMAIVPTTSRSSLCRPNTKEIGCSENVIDDVICIKCLSQKRIIDCDPNVVDSVSSYQCDKTNMRQKTSNLSLKLMDMPTRSLIFSLGENEKLNIKSKSVGTQYQGILKCTIGIQHSNQTESASTQYMVASSNQQTDTQRLIIFKDKAINTVVNPKPVQKDAMCVTDKVQTTENGCNTNPLVQKVDYSTSTDKILQKNVGCGVEMKPHILISCADNYCDTCKDTIKHLANTFNLSQSQEQQSHYSASENSNISPLSSLEYSRIPRPTTLMSPRTDRKFVRQHTNTVPSSTETTPTQEKLTNSNNDSIIR